MDAFREALDAGYDTARLSPPRRRALGQLALYATAADQLDLAVRNVRVLARAAATTVREGEDRPRGALRDHPRPRLRRRDALGLHRGARASRGDPQVRPGGRGRGDRRARRSATISGPACWWARSGRRPWISCGPLAWTRPRPSKRSARPPTARPGSPRTRPFEQRFRLRGGLRTHVRASFPPVQYSPGERPAWSCGARDRASGRKRGIGSAVCRALASRGAGVVFSYWRAYDRETPWASDEDELGALLGELRALGVGAEGVEVDLSLPDSARLFLDAAEERLGRPSILVNTAAYSARDGFENLEAEDARRPLCRQRAGDGAPQRGVRAAVSGRARG